MLGRVWSRRALIAFASAVSVASVVGSVASAGQPPTSPFAFKALTYGVGDAGGLGGVGADSLAPGGYDRIGELPQYSFWSQRLSDRIGLKVNLESGNLIGEQHGLELPGVAGVWFSLDRFWNSQWDDSDGAYGLGWVMGTASDVAFNR